MRSCGTDTRSLQNPAAAEVGPEPLARATIALIDSLLDDDRSEPRWVRMARYLDGTSFWHLFRSLDRRAPRRMEWLSTLQLITGVLCPSSEHEGPDPTDPDR